MNNPIRKVTTWIDKSWAKLQQNNILFDFIIIFTVYLFIAYPTEMVFATETPLGKLAAIFVIIYYASIDFTYGLFACCIILYYYQLDLVDGLVKIEINEKMAENLESMNNLLKEEVPSRETPKEIEPYCGPNHDLYKYESMESTDFNENILLQNARDEFRKENCKNGELYIKGLTVRPEMSDHIFREIKFRYGDKCNPCDESCKFSIIESRLRGEKELREQVSGRDTSPVSKSIGDDFAPIVSTFGNIYTKLTSFVM